MIFFKRARILRMLHKHGIKHALWEDVTSNLAFLQGMTSVEKAHLRELCAVFLNEKRIFGVQDLAITDRLRISVAVSACLPVLHLGLSLYHEWSDIIVYPGVFRISRDEMDAAGIVHHYERVLSGESWSRGPVIIAWDEAESNLSGNPHGHNVIIHEVAHKLDMLNGSANGMPPLHTHMPTSEWSSTLSAAYADLNHHLDLHHKTRIDPYAATSPAEFFAVFSEYFFCAPEILFHQFAEVYRQLSLYYRQDPYQRRLAVSG